MCDQKFRCHLFDYLLVIVSGRNELDQYGDPSNEKKIEKSPWEMYICTLNRSLICSLKGGGGICLVLDAVCTGFWLCRGQQSRRGSCLRAARSFVGLCAAVLSWSAALLGTVTCERGEMSVS